VAFSQDAELRKRWQTKYMATASKSNVKSDTEAFLDFLAKEPDVSSLSIGTTGYCMGGGLSLSAAGNFPDRVVAAASYHGGNLATDDPESPHLLAPRIKARVYVAGAIEDSSFPDSQKRQLADALAAAGVRHTVETYPAKHGWVPTDSVVYDREQSDRHYVSLLGLFEATLRNAPKKS
jgi:carboxymethylenebutenolidase